MAARQGSGAPSRRPGDARNGPGGGGRDGARDLLLARAGGAEVLGAGGAREAGGGAVGWRGGERGGVYGGSLAALCCVSSRVNEGGGRRETAK